ncbi:MAG TPA: DNA repair protein, partial [Acidimicrobiaceae bacterium]|nr:DNA repair protein [Acidimicrobiaceae bacterium]
MSVWVPDWPLVAAGVDPAMPAAVFVANRVVACTAAARAAGVRRHMRRREAQSRAPSLEVLDHDPDRDARAFEAVVHAVEALTPRIEVTRPGRCAFPARGPSRYFGGDEALAARALEVVAEVLAAPAAVGVADGPFAAAHAARTALVRANRSGGGEPPVWVVAPGRAAEYLAPLSLGALDRPELADVLARLGLHSLGDLAALPAADVLGRFGSEGLEAHRLACGLDPRPPATEPPPPDLVVSAELDPPAEQVAPIAFVARGMADELHARLDARGSVCTRIVISAETEHGERSERVWRHEGALSAGAIADRVRWQMDGWLHANVRQRPSAGIAHLWLHPDEVVAA